MTSNLATKLRAGTQQSHAAAEHTGFMQGFLKGCVDQDSFGKLLSNLYCVYSQLELELECHQNHSLVSYFYFPELNRKANLEKDLAFYFGSDWKEKVTPSSAAQAYINRIREVSATEPVLLLAHAYTRYMGDLSGGQGLKKIVQSVMNLPEPQGTAFYDFDQISDLKAFKDKYRQALDELPVDEETADKIVAEANNSFKLNIQMLQELEGSLATAVS